MTCLVGRMNDFAVTVRPSTTTEREQTMTTIQTPENLIRPEVQLTGTDGNAFAIIGAVAKALRRAGNGPDVVAAFQAEATSGDYDHVLQTAMTYAEVE
jgi:hypothetical protein